LNLFVASVFLGYQQKKKITYNLSKIMKQARKGAPAKEKKYVFDQKYIRSALSSDFDVSDDIGARRIAEIREINSVGQVTSYLDQTNILSIPVGQETTFSDSRFASLMKQLGAEFHYFSKSGTEDKNNIIDFSKDTLDQIGTGAIVGGDYAKKTKFIFRDLYYETTQKIKNLEKKIAEAKKTGAHHQAEDIELRDLKTNVERYKFVGPQGFQRKIQAIYKQIESATSYREFETIRQQNRQDPVIGHLFSTGQRILDQKKYTLSYQKYFLQQSLDLVQEQAKTVVATLSKISAAGSGDIHQFVAKGINESRKVITDLEVDFKGKIERNLQKVNQIEKIQVQRLFSTTDPLSVAEKSPAIEPFKSRVLTNSQLSNVLKKEVDPNFILSLNLSVDVLRRIKSRADKKYYSNDVRDIIDEYKKTISESERLRLEGLIGSKLDDHILSSDQTSLMFQFEDMLLDIDEQQFTAKAFAILATGAGKSFLAELAKGYREEIIKSWEMQFYRVDQKQEYSEEETKFLQSQHAFISQAKQDQDWENKLAVQTIIAESGTNNKRINELNLKAIKDNFSIDIINLANQENIRSILEDTAGGEELKPLKGRVYFIDERLYHKDKKSYDDVSKLSRLGAKITLFGANENKILLHQRLRRLLKKQETLDANITDELFSNQFGDHESLAPSLVPSLAKAPTKQSLAQASSLEKESQSYESIRDNLTSDIRALEKNIRKLDDLSERTSQFVISDEVTKNILRVFAYKAFTSGNTDWKKSLDTIKILEQHLYSANLSRTLSPREKMVDSAIHGIVEEMTNSFVEFQGHEKGVGGYRKFKGYLADQIEKNIQSLNENISAINSEISKAGFIVGFGFSMVELPKSADPINTIPKGFGLAIQLITNHLDVSQQIILQSAEEKRNLQDKKNTKRKFDLFFARQRKIQDARDTIKKVEIREDNARNKVKVAQDFSLVEDLAETITNHDFGKLFPPLGAKAAATRTASEPKRRQYIIPRLQLFSGQVENQTELDRLKSLRESCGGYLFANYIYKEGENARHAVLVIDANGVEERFWDNTPELNAKFEEASKSGQEISMIYAGDYEYVVGGDYGSLSKLVAARQDDQNLYISREEDIDDNLFEQLIGRNRSSERVGLNIKIDKALAERLGISNQEDLIKFAVKNRFKKNLEETVGHLKNKLISYLENLQKDNPIFVNRVDIQSIDGYKDQKELVEIINGQKVLKCIANLPRAKSAGTLRRSGSSPSKAAMMAQPEFSIFPYEVGMSEETFNAQDLMFNQVLRPYLFYKSLADEMALNPKMDAISLEKYRPIINAHNDFQFGFGESGIDFSSLFEGDNLVLNIGDHQKSNQILASLAAVPFARKTDAAIERDSAEIVAAYEAEVELVKQEEKRQEEEFLAQIAEINQSLAQVRNTEKLIMEESAKYLSTKKSDQAVGLQAGSILQPKPSENRLNQLTKEAEESRKDISSKIGSLLNDYGDILDEAGEVRDSLMKGIKSSDGKLQRRLTNLDEIEASQLALDKLEEAIRSRITQREEAEERLKKAEFDISDSNALSKQMRGRVKNLAELILERKKEIPLIEQEIFQINQQTSELELDLQTLESANEELKKSVRTLEIQLSQKNEEVKVRKLEIAVLTQSIDDLSAEDLEKRILEEGNQTSVIKERLKELNLELQSKQQNLQQTIKEKEDLDLELSKAKRKFDEKTQELQDKKSEKSRLQDENSSLEQTLIQVAQNIESLKETISSSSTALDDLNDKILQLEGQIEKIIEANKGLETKNEEFQEKLNPLKQELINLHQQFGDLISDEENLDIAKLQETIDAQISSSQALVELLEDRVIQLGLMRQESAKRSSESAKSPRELVEFPIAHAVSENSKIVQGENFLEDAKFPNDFWFSKFSGCTFRKVDFSEAKNLSAASFVGCVFDKGCKFPDNFKFAKDALGGNNIFHKSYQTSGLLGDLRDNEKKDIRTGGLITRLEKELEQQPEEKSKNLQARVSIISGRGDQFIQTSVSNTKNKAVSRNVE
jgi:uncharacterized protein YjbI with pentapeptide repeats